MNKEAIESRFFLKIDDSIVAPPGAEEAYFEARRWSEGIRRSKKAYAGASLYPGEKDGKRGFFVQKIIYSKAN